MILGNIIHEDDIASVYPDVSKKVPCKKAGRFPSGWPA
jgi:hypothetical protein